jgi:hypothetical protein
MQRVVYVLKKKKKAKTRLINKILFIIIILLTIINIIFVNKYFELSKEEVKEVIEFVPTNENYAKEKKYYAKINYKTFKKTIKTNEVKTIAIVDNKSNTSVMFMEMINRMAYYHNTKIYVLELNKLKRKDEIAFYDLDERLSKLDSNYLITVSSGKIISITTFDQEKINLIVKEMSE